MGGEGGRGEGIGGERQAQLKLPQSSPHRPCAMDCWDELCMHAAADAGSAAGPSVGNRDAFDLHDSDDQGIGPDCLTAFDLRDTDSEAAGQAVDTEAPGPIDAASTWNQWVAQRKGDQFAGTPAQCSGKSNEWTLQATMRSAFTFHRRGPFGTNAVQSTRLNHWSTICTALRGPRTPDPPQTRGLRHHEFLFSHVQLFFCSP